MFTVKYALIVCAIWMYVYRDSFQRVTLIIQILFTTI